MSNQQLKFEAIGPSHALNKTLPNSSGYDMTVHGYMQAPVSSAYPNGFFLISTFSPDDKNVQVIWSYFDSVDPSSVDSSPLETIDQLSAEKVRTHRNNFLIVEKTPDPRGEDNDVVLSCGTGVNSDYGVIQKVKRITNVDLALTSLIHATEDILVASDENTKQRLKSDTIIKQMNRYFTYD